MNLSNTDNKEIVTALPHKKPFIMIDTLCYLDDAVIIAEFTITEDNIFVQESYFHEPGIMEHMAQSAALRSTLKAQQKGEETPLGYFAGIKKFNLYKCPKINATLKTTVRNIVVLDKATVVNVETVCNEHMVATAEMSFYMV